MQEISPELVSERLQHQLVELIDVRTPMEYHELHVEGSRNIPLDSLDFNRLLSTRKGEDTDPIYLICRSGMRAKKACEKLIDQGFENVCMIHGGVLAWEAAGLPLVRGKKVMVGAIDVATNEIETPEEVAATLRKALNYVDADKLYPCTNCGMTPLSRDVARGKLKALAAGAAIVREELAATLAC